MRQTESAIRERRRDRRHVLLTGASGFVGSHLAVALLNKGYSLTLICRSRGSLSANERIARMTRWFDVASNQIRVVEGDISNARLGLAEPEYSDLLSSVDEILHCAADTSFEEGRRADVESINVGGTQNMLEFAARSTCYRFHHVSTAYVAGQTEGLCLEEHAHQEEFNNPYEETKHLAENHVLSVCRREGIRVSVYRPSIIYGDSRTGRTTAFNAFYIPIRLADSLKRSNRKRQGDPQLAGDSATVQLPVRLAASSSGACNLVPIDFVVSGCLAIMEDEDCLDGGIFHLVSPEPTDFRHLLAFTEKYLNVSGIDCVPRSAFATDPMTDLERFVDVQTELYRPYFYDSRVFDTQNAAEVLNRHDIACPPLTYEVFARCVEYAIAVNWRNQLHGE